MNSKLSKIRKQMKRQEKEKTIQGPETDKVRKTFLEKLKSFFCFCRAKKTADKRPLTAEPKKTFLEKVNAFFRCKRWKNHCLKKSGERNNLTDETQKTFLEKILKTSNSRLAKFNHAIKKHKNGMQKQDKSIRMYIKQNCKWVILFLVVYIIIFGAVVSGPILVNHFRVLNRNETEQERSMIGNYSKELFRA